MQMPAESAFQQDALCLMLASNDTDLDQILPTPASLLGGEQRLMFLLLALLHRLGNLSSCRLQLLPGLCLALFILAQTFSPHLLCLVPSLALQVTLALDTPRNCAPLLVVTVSLPMLT
jgi:hypothetical protein